ncbi:hypothetical protein SprV_0301182700 [Sparganum proliferum]
MLSARPVSPIKANWRESTLPRPPMPSADEGKSKLYEDLNALLATVLKVGKLVALAKTSSMTLTIDSSLTPATGDNTPNASPTTILTSTAPTSSDVDLAPICPHCNRSFTSRIGLAEIPQLYAVSDRQHYHQLIKEESLGDQKPSEVLRRMGSLVEDMQFDENLVKAVFLECLPAYVQMILSSGSQDLMVSHLAEMADQKIEPQRFQPPSVAQISISSSTVNEQ